jgi:hypothetical protein
MNDKTKIKKRPNNLRIDIPKNHIEPSNLINGKNILVTSNSQRKK